MKSSHVAKGLTTIYVIIRRSNFKCIPQRRSVASHPGLSSFNGRIFGDVFVRNHEKRPKTVLKSFKNVLSWTSDGIEIADFSQRVSNEKQALSCWHFDRKFTWNYGFTKVRNNEDARWRRVYMIPWKEINQRTLNWWRRRLLEGLFRV